MSERLRNGLVAVVIVGLMAFVAMTLAATTPVPKNRAVALEERLRCPVCKSVSIAESLSPTAASMRRIVARQVAAGRSDAEVVEYFQRRYGPWVLIDPPKQGRTLLLWVLPVVGVLVGGAVLLRRRGSGRDSSGYRPVVLSPSDQADVQAAKERHRYVEVVDDP